MSSPVSLRSGVWFQGGLDVKTTTELAVRAEAAGADCVWVAEGPIARDAFIALSSIAVATERVSLATGVVNPFTRHPAQLAASFASLDELSRGRAVCGIGIGARDGLIPLGADVSKPLAAARETIVIVRRLLARENVVIDGKVFDLHNVRLGFRPAREDVPIYLAATGPKMCALAGKEADGIYLMYGTRNYVQTSLQRALDSREADPHLRVASPIPVGVDSGDESSKFRLKVAIGLMLTEPNGEGMLAANDVEPEHAQRIRDGLAQGGIKGLGASLDDVILDRLAIYGAHSACVERLQEAASWGINEPQILLAGDDPAPALAVLRDFRSASV
ncbi:MAG: LLM class flavin-dependent oxidoreductase [Actinomycetota bacterium]